MQAGGSSGGTARERREAKVRRRRTIRTVVVAAVVVVLTVTGGGAAWYLTSEVGTLRAQSTTAKDLLTTSDRKVADEATRAALSAQISTVDQLLAQPFYTRFPTETVDARQPLAAASDAVRGSMVEFARNAVTTGRRGLAAADARGQKIFTATEGKGVADAIRSNLRSALDTSAAVDEATSDVVASENLAELEKAVLDMRTSISTLTVSTDALSEAQDAVTCPAPDQVWDPDSGVLPSSALVAIPWAPKHFVRADVLDGLVELDAAYQQAFGEHLTINSAYRTLVEQKALYDPASATAAAPGCSTHGLGLAVDIGGGVQAFGTEQYNWLKANASTYGWAHPTWAEPNGRVPEPWHWQSVLAPANAA